MLANIVRKRNAAVWIPTLNENFNGAAGSAPNSAIWVPETVNSCNGSTIRSSFASDDAYLDGNGSLVLRAQSRVSGGCGPNHYTSGQISTRGLFSQAYGKFEASILLPAGGDGIWPAWWMYPISGPAWPAGGEIDILEMNSDMTRADMTYHYGPDEAGHQSSFVSYSDAALASGYHTYGVEWDPGNINWLIDGIVRRSAFTGADVSSTPMNLLLGFQVGRYEGTAVTPTLPQTMSIDYVRAWRRAN